MSIDELAKILVRRVWVVLVVGLLTVAAAVTTFVSVPDEFETQRALLMEPRQTGDAATALERLPIALSEALSSGDLREVVVANGGTSAYQTTAADGVVEVVAIDASADTAISTVRQVLSEASAELGGLAERSDVNADRVSLRELASPGLAGVDDLERNIAQGSLQVVVRTAAPNPYTNGQYAADVMTELVADRFERERDVTIDVETNTRDVAPVVQYLVRSDSQERTALLVAEINDFVDEQLVALQENLGIDASEQTLARPLSGLGEPRRIPAAPIRSAAVIVVLGGLLTLVAAVAVDAYAARRAAAANWVAYPDDEPGAAVDDPDQAARSDVPGDDVLVGDVGAVGSNGHTGSSGGGGRQAGSGAVERS